MNQEFIGHREHHEYDAPDTGGDEASLGLLFAHELEDFFDQDEEGDEDHDPDLEETGSLALRVVMDDLRVRLGLLLGGLGRLTIPVSVAVLDTYGSHRT